MFAGSVEMMAERGMIPLSAVVAIDLTQHAYHGKGRRGRPRRPVQGWHLVVRDVHGRRDADGGPHARRLHHARPEAGTCQARDRRVQEGRARCGLKAQDQRQEGGQGKETRVHHGRSQGVQDQGRQARCGVPRVRHEHVRGRGDGRAVQYPNRVQEEVAIETGYRTASEARARTKSNSVSMRLFLFYFTLASLNVWAMVNYEADTERIRKGLLERARARKERRAAFRARGRGPKKRRWQRNWRNVVTRDAMFDWLRIVADKMFLPPPPRAAPIFWPAWRWRLHGLRRHVLPPSRARTRAPPLPRRPRFWSRKLAEAGSSGLFSPRSRVCPKHAPVWGPPGPGRQKNRDSKVWAPRSAALYILPASY